ncbi:hypothetical protein, partial [Pseudomonas aeruginosa]
NPVTVLHSASATAQSNAAFGKLLRLEDWCFGSPRQRENSQGIRLRRVLWGETKFRGKTLHSCRFSGIRQERRQSNFGNLELRHADAGS